jgi:hypothetical protein
MSVSPAIPVIWRSQLSVRWIARFCAICRMPTLYHPDRHIGRLSPHQLRDIGLPEILSDRARFHSYHRILEKIK